jgi:GNAT superfamily N-acetyltransferase
VDEPARSDVHSALENELHFVLALGGFALRTAGATLVTHERLPSPRFNFVEVHGVAPERQTAFFERTLDHYFQRAIRPTFRLHPPVPSHLDSALRRLGLQPRADPLDLLVDSGAPGDGPSPGGRVRAATLDDLDDVCSFWTTERERPEFRSALEVAWSHPNPGERLRPLLALSEARPVSAALVYERGTTSGVYAVATRPDARGQGAASALVAFARSPAFAGARTRSSIFAGTPRLRSRLQRLGFSVAASFTEYELPRDAQLAVPPPGPPGPPRWRPPRRP